jgi:hypothetical protein
MEVFLKVLEFLVEVATPDPKFEHIHSFDIDYFIKKQSRRLFDYEYIDHISILCIPLTIFVVCFTLSSYSICGVLFPLRSFLLFELDEML